MAHARLRRWAVAKALGTFVRSHRPRSGTRVILRYHSVGSASPLAEPTEAFEAQMRYARRWFTVLPLREFTDALAAAAPANLLAVTFDDGYVDNETVVRPLLDRLGIRATFFIVTGSMGREFQTSGGRFGLMAPTQVKSLAAAGHEIGSHTVGHPRLPEVPADAAVWEVSESKAMLEDLLGTPVTSFAYPKGRVNDAVQEYVVGAGYHRAVGTRRGFVRPDADPFALPRFSIRDYVRAAVRPRESSRR